MAVTSTLNGGATIITLGSLDADYNYTTDFPNHVNGIRVHSIEYVPTIWSTDVCQLKDGSATGPVIFNAASLNRFPIKYFGGDRIKPYYDISDTNKCNASATAKIIIHLAGFSG